MEFDITRRGPYVDLGAALPEPRQYAPVGFSGNFGFGVLRQAPVGPGFRLRQRMGAFRRVLPMMFLFIAEKQVTMENATETVRKT